MHLFFILNLIALLLLLLLVIIITRERSTHNDDYEVENRPETPEVDPEAERRPLDEHLHDEDHRVDDVEDA